MPTDVAYACVGHVLCKGDGLGCAMYCGECPRLDQDFVSLQDYEEAIRLSRALLNGINAKGDRSIGPIGQAWLERTIGHLYTKVDRYFRDRPPLKDEKQFLAYLKTMAQGYREGAQALHWAAERLHKKHHDTHGANETEKASRTMARAAQELIG